MAEQLRGKSIVAVAHDIAEGFFSVNPLILKKFEVESCRALHQQLRKLQSQVRAERFPLHDADAIRHRNSRLQRLHNAVVVLERFAHERRIRL